MEEIEYSSPASPFKSCDTIGNVCEGCQGLDLSLANILRLQSQTSPNLDETTHVLREWSASELKSGAGICYICRFFFDISAYYQNEGFHFRIHVGVLNSVHHNVQNKSIFAPFIGFDYKVKISLTEERWLGRSVLAYRHCSPSELPGKVFVAQNLVRERADFEKIKRWLHNCQQNHRGYCLNPGLEKVRTANQLEASPYQQSDTSISVIVCSSKKIVRYQPHLGEYATLSYVWGTAAGLSANTMTEWLPHHIPKTIQDALTICAQLGIPYLWVDRYCIPQNNLKERSRQIGIMDEIYYNSALTIIAAAGDNPEHGLPGVNGTPRTTEFKTLAFGIDTWVHLSDDMFRKEIRNSTWNTRAWTYQEGVVSRRRLVFTESQVHFECPTESLWEVLDMLPDHEILSGDLGKMDILCTSHGMYAADRFFVPWASTFSFDTIVQQFFGRHISYPKDIINALAGVISWFNKRNRIWALSGLVINCQDEKLPLRDDWYEYALFDALAWTYLSTVKRKLEFFSWTWAGWEVDESNLTSSESPYLCHKRAWYQPDLQYLCMQQIKIGTCFGSSLNTINWSNISDMNLNSCDPMLCAEYLLLDAWTFLGKIVEFDFNPQSPSIRISLPNTWSHSLPFPSSRDGFTKEFWVSESELESVGIGAEVLILPLFIDFFPPPPYLTLTHWSRRRVHLPVLILKPTGTTTSLELGAVDGDELQVYQRIGSSILLHGNPGYDFETPISSSEELAWWNIDFFQRASGMVFEKKKFTFA